jgi:hypothetical protein
MMGTPSSARRLSSTTERSDTQETDSIQPTELIDLSTESDQAHEPMCGADTLVPRAMRVPHHVAEDDMCDVALSGFREHAPDCSS